MRAVIVTGTPGTGKTTVARAVAGAYGLRYIDVNRLISRRGLSEGYDCSRKCRIVDVARLRRELVSLVQQARKQPVIDSHLSHCLPKRCVALCIVTQCSLRTLRRRLEARRYPESKIRENLDSEIFEICRTEAEEMGHSILLVKTDRRLGSRNLALIGKIIGKSIKTKGNV